MRAIVTEWRIKCRTQRTREADAGPVEPDLAVVAGDHEPFVGRIVATRRTTAGAPRSTPADNGLRHAEAEDDLVGTMGEGVVLAASRGGPSRAGGDIAPLAEGLFAASIGWPASESESYG